MTMPILPGTDGIKRMSKSTGNYIGVSEAPEEQFGKVMSIPDDAMATYYELLFPHEPPPTGPPVEEKRRLGRLVADRFHGAGAGATGEAHFNRVTRDRQAPEQVPEVVVAAGTVHLPALLADSLGVPSRGEARRLITQGGVSVDGKRVDELDVAAEALEGRVVRAGKRRFARIRIG